MRKSPLLSLKATCVAVTVLLNSFLPSLAEPNEYTVSDEVLIEKPNRFGMNFSNPNFLPWSPQRSVNIWSNRYAFEPIITRFNSQATGGSEDSLEDFKGKPWGVNPQSGRVINSWGGSYWGTSTDGFWDGATIEIYRPTEDSLDLLRKAKVKQFIGTKGEEKFILDSKGPAVQQGDVYVVTNHRLDIHKGLAPNKGKARKQANGLFDEGKQKQGGRFQIDRKGEGYVQWVIDDTTHCPEGGSTASMKVTVTGEGDEIKGMGHQYLRWEGKERNFNPGKEYYCEIWLRQEGIEDGKVTVQIGDRGTKVCDVTDKWQKFTFDLDNTTPVSKGIPYLVVGSTKPGTFWMDNLGVFEKGLEPFALYPMWQEALNEYRPGIIRDMSGLGLFTLDNWLSRGFERKSVWHPDAGVNEGWDQGNTPLPYYLEMCKACGANPYLMTYILPSDEEIDGFVEYLAAPADVGYGKLRAKHGHPKPWTEEFDKIYVECANETWNGTFNPQAFPSQPELAGKVSNRLFQRIKASKWFKKGDFSCVASAFVHSLYRWKNPDGSWKMDPKAKAWTLRCTEKCPGLDSIATGPTGYIGGWDGSSVVGESDDDLFQANLLYSARLMEPKLEDIDALRAELKKLHGLDEIEMTMYEAGPGYSLPSPDKPWREEEERIGKSLALGVVTLDNFLFVIANNGNLNFFKLNRGNNWSSHNMEMQPHSTWLALLLRNKHCTGSLLKVTPGEQNTIDLPEQQMVGLDNSGKRRKGVMKAMSGIPLTRLYAFKDGNKTNLIFLNRSFKESQELKVTLPFKPKAEAKMISLTHEDPRATNRTEEQLKLVESTLSDMGQTHTFTLAPASAYVVTCETE